MLVHVLPSCQFSLERSRLVNSSFQCSLSRFDQRLQIAIQRRKIYVPSNLPRSNVSYSCREIGLRVVLSYCALPNIQIALRKYNCLDIYFINFCLFRFVILSPVLKVSSNCEIGVSIHSLYSLGTSSSRNHTKDANFQRE